MRRLALQLAAVAFAALGIYRFVYGPMHCNFVEAQLNATTEHAFHYDRTPEGKIVARDARTAGLNALEHCPSNVDLRALVAANDIILGRNDEAADEFARALTYDRRPELFLQLGQVEAKLGRNDAAREHLVAAARFDPSLLREIEEPSLRESVSNAVAAATAERPNELLDADFRVGPRGAKTTLATTATDPMRGTTSAARNWGLYNNSPSTSVTELVPSTRTPGRMMLHVSTTERLCGVIQGFHDPETGPGAATATVWVFVRSGRVMLGSGNGAQAQHPDATSTTTGRWERLEARSSSCPVNQIVIYALDGAADFDIEAPAVRAIAGEACMQ